MDSFGVEYKLGKCWWVIKQQLSMFVHIPLPKIILCTGTWLMNIIEHKSKGVIISGHFTAHDSKCQKFIQLSFIKVLNKYPHLQQMTTTIKPEKDNMH